MDLGIAGKVALVTAGSRGLGRACASALAAEGVRVMVSGRDAASLEATRQSLADQGADVGVSAGDVTDPGEPARLVAATVERFGGLDILVANAGGPPPGRAVDLTDEALESALNANLMTSIRLVREALPHMRNAGWGRICCITSYTVQQAVPVLALSNTARAGLWGWMKTAAQDLAAESGGITINMVCPGPHATDRMKELGGSGPMGDPADFGSVAAFLCSRQAGFVNGAAIVVDGGSTLAL
jgi:3-oxoacyl-[acyl-carrier protein] reductase